MATKQKKKTTKNKVAINPGPLATAKNTVCTFRKENKLLFVVIIISIVLLSVFLVWQLLVWREKQQFNKAEAALDSLTTDIVAKLSEPQSVTKEKSCGYKSEPYDTVGESPSCYVAYSVQFETNNPLPITDIVYAIDDLIDSRNDIRLITNLTDTINQNRDFSYEPSAQSSFVINNTSLNCSVVIRDDRNSDGQMTVRFSCGSQNNLKAHYPVTE